MDFWSVRRQANFVTYSYMKKLYMKFQHDIWGIALIAIGLFLGLSLATYNPLDPSLNSIGQGLKVANAVVMLVAFWLTDFFNFLVCLFG